MTNPTEMRTISDYALRRVPREDRKELFSYVPRKRILTMTTMDLQHVLAMTYNRDDLYQRVAHALNY